MVLICKELLACFITLKLKIVNVEPEIHEGRNDWKSGNDEEHPQPALQRVQELGEEGKNGSGGGLAGHHKPVVLASVPERIHKLTVWRQNRLNKTERFQNFIPIEKGIDVYGYQNFVRFLQIETSYRVPKAWAVAVGRRTKFAQKQKKIAQTQHAKKTLPPCGARLNVR